MSARFTFLFLILILAGPGGPLAAQPAPADVLAVEALPPEFFTFEPEEYWREPRDSYWMRFSNWVMEQQSTQSRRIQTLGAWADRTLSGSAHAATDNESYLRLGLAAESETGQLADASPEARFRLDVPTLEEKFRVIIESESDELIPLGERRRDRRLTAEQRTDTGATGALRMLSRVSDHINLSNDVGIRARIPADAFWRAQARGRFRLAGDWTLAASQRVYYFHQSGWGETTWVGLSRPLPGGWHFLSASEKAWVHDERRFELAQTLNFHKRLNNRAVISPRLGILGESQPGWRHTNMFADVTYRYRLYDDWLYGEIIPAIEFPREDSFKDRTSLLLRIEMYFSGELRHRQ